MTDITNNLTQINSCAATDAKTLIDACELRYNTMLKSIASRIPHAGQNTILMLAGPSSSGKTTTAKKLSEHLREDGIISYTISLDDFYIGPESAPISEDGTPDFETIHALDLQLLNKVITDILSIGESDIPRFDFSERRRSDKTMHLELGERDVVIFEGLHALNPLITDSFPSDRLIKLYVSVSTRIYDDDGNVVLSKRDLRLLRRIVRDYKHRNSSVDYSFNIWQNVVKGEDKYLFPFEYRADMKLNSFHSYEPCVLRDEAINVLSTLQGSSKFSEKRDSLVENLKKFTPLSQDLIPPTSLLNEFAGNR